MRTLLALSATIALSANTLSAQTVAYSTFGPNDTYNNAFGWSVAHILPGASPFQPAGAKYWLASSFTVGGAPQALDRVRVAAVKSRGALPFTSGDAILDLLTGPTLQQATTIESWTLSSSINDQFSIYSLASITGTTLYSTETYWIRMRPAAPNTLWGWAPNNQNILGLYTSPDEGANWIYGNSAAGAFEIQSVAVRVVPEPNTMALICTGLLAVICTARRHRRHP